jgi:deazaflavin-dependent oxidoreductase (nitroreductase family)
MVAILCYAEGRERLSLEAASMSEQEKIFDSPTGWVNKHIQNYLEKDGGDEWRPGVPTLLLTTRGRKSGKLRRTALIYGQDGEDCIVVASRGGHKHHPAWYLNLVANPEVELRVLADTFEARAHVANAEEKARLWPLMTAIWPAYDDYQTRTSREIPVIVLSPVT